MNLYFELLKSPVFTVEDVNKYYDNMNSARSAIKRLMKEGIVAKIRNNMYTCISGETGAPIANQFLYQKMGFLLSEHKEKMGLSDEFFDICKSQIGKSKRYLTKDMSEGSYINEWKLVTPNNMYSMKNGVAENEK